MSLAFSHSTFSGLVGKWHIHISKSDPEVQKISIFIVSYPNKSVSLWVAILLITLYLDILCESSVDFEHLLVLNSLCAQTLLSEPHDPSHGAYSTDSNGNSLYCFPAPIQGVWSVLLFWTVTCDVS